METSTSAATQAQASERNARLTKTFAYYSAFIVLGLAASAFGPTLTGLARHTGSTIEQISILFVLRSLGYLFGSLLAGQLYDRVRGHPLMVFVTLVLLGCVALVPVIPMLWLMGFVVLLLGTAEGLLDVGGNTLLVWVHRDQMGPFMNGLHFFFGLGAFLSPIIIAQAVLMSGDIYWAYWALAIIMLPTAIWLSRLPSPTHLEKKQSAESRPALPVLIALIALFNFVYVGAEVGYGSWIPTYAMSMNLANEVGAAYLASGFWGSLTAGRLLSIPVATRFSPRVMLAVDLAIVIASLMVVLAFPGQLLALWVGTLGTGFGMASIFPTMLTLAERHMTMTGNVTSWFFVGSSVGGMTLPWLIGQLFKPLGAPVAMWTVLISTLIDLLIFAAVMGYVRKLGK